ncbi:MAG: hypothetical protein WC119_01145 [Synergistaceae bacterium]
MSIKALQEYTRFSKYARYNFDAGRRESWEEQVDRVFNMHRERFGDEIISLIQDDFEFAKKMVIQKRVLGSQRALQFGGKPILTKNDRIYNCSASYCDRPRFFQECMYLLLCGCGTGFSVQKEHVAKLPPLIKEKSNGIKVFKIADDIEGWADSIGVLVSSYFDSDSTPFPEYKGYKVEFDVSAIRPQGSPISSGSKAPGPEPLYQALVKIDHLLDKTSKKKDKLDPIDAYDVVMYASDAVLSGGVRRSATISIFSADDEDMLKAKTGSWFIENKQRSRSNNSVLLIRDETNKDDFLKIIEAVKEYGEPGFIWADNKDFLVNPCAEISFFAKMEITRDNKNEFLDEIRMQGDDKFLSGWGYCNLCEINVKKAKTESEFLDACRASAILGTLQAGYTTFNYLGRVSEEICRSEALLGVSMTGMADNPEIAFDPKLQRKGAKLILEVNERISKIIGINPSARTTCVKPAGSSSCILGTASGIHPHHAKRYFRRVQANKIEVPLQYFEKFNPMAVEQSVWNHNDKIISFLCEVPDGAKTKNSMNAIAMLDLVKLTQQNWVESGVRLERCLQPWLRHNVSNTINIRPEEWDDVGEYIYKNRKWFTGISMLPMSGDKDYPQAPFCAVYTPSEIVKEYGDGSIMASGLIVDGLRVFKNDLFAACDCALGIGEIIDVDSLRSKIERDCETNGSQWKKEGLSGSSPEKLLKAWLQSEVENYRGKSDWVRRARQFANRYFGGDIKKMTYCLKDVTNWKLWCDLHREYVAIDWSQCFEDDDGNLEFGGAGSACSGGACDLGDLGLAIAQHKEDKKTSGKSLLET